MAKQSPDVLLFPRIASARAEEAAQLLQSGLSQAAVYLGGYEVECLLKALLLTATRPADRALVPDEFRGQGGHNPVYLLGRYSESVGAAPPRPVALAFVVVTRQWSTDLRYDPRTRYTGDAAGYFAAVRIVTDWARGRMS